ncbi:Hypothetical protein SMAX5B_009377 [Scophthalmus maximus]|uniref:Uncharacterized protein n=1 Tax=Scophthalmus maximus TaxID=52904 RepID=A0A2U9C7X9_SCOMX|nr:Hypothetical protein SMAX5B_009377 [Scophthalmus maximus]
MQVSGFTSSVIRGHIELLPLMISLGCTERHACPLVGEPQVRRWASAQCDDLSGDICPGTPPRHAVPRRVAPPLSGEVASGRAAGMASSAAYGPRGRRGGVRDPALATTRQLDVLGVRAKLSRKSSCHFCSDECLFVSVSCRLVTKLLEIQRATLISRYQSKQQTEWADAGRANKRRAPPKFHQTDLSHNTNITLFEQRHQVSSLHTEEMHTDTGER